MKQKLINSKLDSNIGDKKQYPKFAGQNYNTPLIVSYGSLSRLTSTVVGFPNETNAASQQN